MATIRKQYKGFKIRFNVVKYLTYYNYRYSVTGTDIKGEQSNLDDAWTCALEDIEDYIEKK